MAQPIQNPMMPNPIGSNPAAVNALYQSLGMGRPNNQRPGQQGVGAALAAMRKKPAVQRPKFTPGQAAPRQVPYGNGSPAAPTTRI